MGKLAFFSLIVMFCSVSLLIAAPGSSQNLRKVPVSVRFSQAKLGEMLDTLEARAAFHFSYPAYLRERGPVSLHLPQSNLQEVLQQLATALDLQFTRTDGQIAVREVVPGKAPEQATGAVRGRVVDFETSTPLPGATVVLMPLNKGQATDEKGYYQLAGIPAGKYVLKVSFIGYQEYQLPITVTEKNLVLDIKLQPAANLNTVEIKTRKGFSQSPVSYTSEKELLTTIRNARGIVSGISNEQIVKSADRNAAEVVRRVAGVTIVDDKFIIVRGMNPRYNLTYLNDNLAPSTEVYNRSFAYDMIPAPVIDRILVFKSPSAELMGDYAGGAVKVFTKNTKPVRHFDMGIQGGFREGNTFSDFYVAPKSSTDWLGFDNGLRKLPAYLPTYRASGGRYKMSQQEMISGFSDQWSYHRKKAMPDMQLFLNYFDNFRLGRWRLYNLTSLTYTNENRHYEQQRQTGNTHAYRLDKYGFQVGGANTIGVNDLSTQVAKVNLMQNFTLRIDSANRIEWKNFFLNEGKNTVGIQINKQNSDPAFAVQDNFRETKQNLLQFQQRLLYNGNLDGYHTLGAKKKQQLHWNLGYAYSKQDIPDQRVSRFYRAYAPTGIISAEDPKLHWIVDYGVSENQLFYGMANRFFVQNRENTYSAAIDYSLQLSPSFLLKAGTYQLFRNRVVERRFFKVTRGGLTGDETTLQFTSGGWDNNGRIHPGLLTFREQDLASFWQPHNFRDDGSGLQLYDKSSPIDRYVASEQNNSGYIQGEWTGLDSTLTVQAGLRFEHHQQQVSGAAAYGSIFLPLQVKLPQDQLLPSIQVNYRPGRSWVFRASYGRTVNRPELREIAPFSDFDFVNQERISGNTLLTGTVIDNYDFRVELYPRSNGNETVSAGIFYKNLDKPVERLRFANGNEVYVGQTGITYFNADKATVYGLEVELRKQLDFIPGALFRNLSVVFNGAWMESKASRAALPARPAGVITVAGDKMGVFKDRPLQGQAPYVINAGLYYENPGWGTKFGVLFNVSGPSIYALADVNAEELLQLRNKKDGYTLADYVTLETKPDLLELPRKLLDFSFTQRLYKSLQMKLNIQNLLDEPVHIVEDQNFNHRYDREQATPAATEQFKGLLYYEGDNTYLKYRTGRYYTVTFTYSF
ncbi:TonB-dependent receptor [Chitinophaga nivalis]|uniref:TonB-dependent receptor n=1 Tax=Chitinophaga nivalis TaxID=2991709 RepID=A0ABT3IP64_9BACT|nr:TonB-dependent receptor [Chitinophaga nivalis]MCW3464795.1 TonB-dependent receptor [Chitinophaga nivalis]MCW3485514.1 TonB-dependent receptor [Chitinophaga nivalis]